jgi:hypothetical protein
MPQNRRARHGVCVGMPKQLSTAVAVLAAIALVAILAVMPCAHAARPLPGLPRSDGSRFEKAEDVLAFINGYRDDKRPKRLPAAVRAMSRLGLLREPEEAGIYIGFIAGVLGENGDTAEKLVADMFPMSPEDQVILIKAIAYSGLPDWKGLLSKFVERMPARKVLLDRYLYRGGPLLDQLMTVESGAFAIDVHWGRYFATAEPEPAQKIIATLAWTADRDSVEKLTIGSMAKWTLATNAARDKGLRDIMTDEVNRQTEVVRKPLSEVLLAAETMETSRIKKDALKTIEELKAKGPQSARNTAWWGQAGQTVLALGCVAASALGQVEFGIPCVIGGALSTAALKYLGPQQ